MYKHVTFDSGRDCLRYIIKKYGITEMHIPYYLCDAVRHTLAEEKCKPVFYHINDNFYPINDFRKKDFILYPNYWGICTKNTEKLVQKYPKVIVDNAHAFFNAPIGFACFNAGHKFGFKESYAFIRDKSAMNWPISNNHPYAISRKKSFLELHMKYGKKNLINIDIENDKQYTPFVYPFLAKTESDADLLVKELKKDGKIIYRYWNPLPKSFCEYKFYSRLVPIPIN